MHVCMYINVCVCVCVSVCVCEQGSQKQLDLCLGVNNSSNIASIEDRPSRPGGRQAESPLILQQSQSHRQVGWAKTRVKRDLLRSKRDLLTQAYLRDASVKRDLIWRKRALIPNQKRPADTGIPETIDAHWPTTSLRNSLSSRSSFFFAWQKVK